MTPEELAKLTPKELQEYTDGVRKRREDRAEREGNAKKIQEAYDLTRIDALEDEHCSGRVAAAPLRGWAPDSGAVTRIAVIIPKRSDRSYQRFQRLVLQHRKNPHKSIEAIEQLARMCLAYPHPEHDKEAYDATLELAPVMLSTIAKMAQDLADADDEVDAKKSAMS